MTRRLTTSTAFPALAAAMALALAGCGGGSGPGTPERGADQPETDTTPATPATPGTPTTPGTPGTPATPATPGTPGTPTGGAASASETYYGFVTKLVAPNADLTALLTDLEAARNEVVTDEGDSTPRQITATQYNTLYELWAVLETPDPNAGDATLAQNAKVRDVARLIARETDKEALNGLVPMDSSITEAQKGIFRYLIENREDQLERLENIQAALLDSQGMRIDLGTAAPDGESLSGNYGVWLQPNMISIVLGNPTVGETNDNDATYGYADLQFRDAELTTGPGLTDRTVGTTAVYDGYAEGYAALDDKSASGEITANVYLNATFGAAPAISGNVDEFRFVGQDGDLSGWDASLSGRWTEAEGFVPGTPGGVSTDAAKPSTWAVELYTTSGQGEMQTPHKGIRPTNALGQFDLSFDDGRAVGAFDIGRKGTLENSQEQSPEE